MTARASALLGSVVAHAVLTLFVLLLPRLSPSEGVAPRPPDRLSHEIVWLFEPGPGGGGGNRTPELLKPAKEIGADRLTVPIADPPAPTPRESKP